MKPVFADTGYWVALFDERDSLHNRAVAAARATAHRRIVTSQFVLVEVLNHFSKMGARLRRQVSASVIAMGSQPEVHIGTLSPERFDAAVALYQQRPDKAWSLVDCASFLLMREQRITEAMTHDQHFEQVGFRALLRSP